MPRGNRANAKANANNVRRDGAEFSRPCNDVLSVSFTSVYELAQLRFASDARILRPGSNCLPTSSTSMQSHNTDQARPNQLRPSTPQPPIIMPDSICAGSAPHQRSPEPFRFLDPPKDIRLMVYDLLPIATRHRTINSAQKLHLKIVTRYLSGVSVLIACRTINQEATPVHKKLQALRSDPPETVRSLAQVGSFLDAGRSSVCSKAREIM